MSLFVFLLRKANSRQTVGGILLNYLYIPRPVISICNEFVIFSFYYLLHCDVPDDIISQILENGGGKNEYECNLKMQHVHLRVQYG
jgi:hypothetical protein